MILKLLNLVLRIKQGNSFSVCLVPRFGLLVAFSLLGLVPKRTYVHISAFNVSYHMRLKLSDKYKELIANESTLRVVNSPYLAFET